MEAIPHPDQTPDNHQILHLEICSLLHCKRNMGEVSVLKYRCTPKETLQTVCRQQIEKTYKR